MFWNRQKIVWVKWSRIDYSYIWRPNVKGQRFTNCKCGKPRHKAYRNYCLECGRAECRKRRKNIPRNAMSEKQLFKARARDITKKALRAGKLQKQPCKYCGNIKSEMHHPDYNQPLNIIWLCKQCHTKIHFPRIYRDFGLEVSS